jgi:hypothetical protein
VHGGQRLIELSKRRIFIDQFFIPVMRVLAIEALTIQFFVCGECDLVVAVLLGRAEQAQMPRRASTEYSAAGLDYGPIRRWRAWTSLAGFRARRRNRAKRSCGSRHGTMRPSDFHSATPFALPGLPARDDGHPIWADK